MKRFLALLLVAVLTLSLATAASAARVQPTKQNITIDGEDVYCPAYNIDGYNYVKLRTLAYLMRDTACPFDVQYDEATKTVSVTTGTAYTGEAEEAFIMADLSDSAVRSAQTVVIDGDERSDLSVWNLGGNNWFKLAELSEALGFGLSYDKETNTAAIRTQYGDVVGSASDYAEVYAAISKARGGSAVTRVGGAVAVEETADEAEAPAAVNTASSATKDASGGTGGDYSGTNVQVEGVDEGDIVKTDGKYIYVIHYDELIILKADGANTVEVSRTEIGRSNYESSDGKTDYSYWYEYKNPDELFVGDGRLAVISNYSSYRENRLDGKWNYTSKNYTCVDIYDVSDPAAPKLVSSLGQDGYDLGTRMVGSKVYLVTNYWVWNCVEEEPSTYVPVLYKNDEMHILPVEKIYINPACESTEYVVACVYDLATGETAASQSILGCGDTLFMNESGVYVLGSRWKDTVTDKGKESVYTVEEHVNASATEIIRLDTEDLSVKATGAVPGYMDSQFSADEYQGYLRLVTTRNDNCYTIYRDEAYGFENYKWADRKTTNGLYILDGSLAIVGKVEDLAPGERVYSARFDGDIAYFCTFRNVDPLFAADLSDPTAPKVLSELKISGFSEYLHAWSENRLFGLGQEADEESGWTECLKLVMFDTTDKANVTVKHTLQLSDCDWSEALYDHKAVFIDPVRNYIGFAADDEYRIYTYDDANGFRLVCSFEAENYWFGGARGFRIGDAVYIVTNEAAVVIDMNGWTRLLTLPLEEAVG